MKWLRSALVASLAVVSLAFTPAVQGQTTSLVSVNSAGTNSANAQSFLPGQPGPTVCYHSRECTSTNGRFVVFMSNATDLTSVPDTNGAADVFVRDTLLGTTTLVSINSAGTAAGNAGAISAFISADGTKVAFASASSDLVATDTNGATDVFVRDLVAGTTTLVSVNAAGTDSGNGSSDLGGGLATSPGRVMSADGNRVIFSSDASNLVATDTNTFQDAFVRDVSAGTTTLVSVNLAGTDSGNFGSSAGSISADGNRVAFDSAASNLVATPDTNGNGDVFVRDLMAGTTILVSINAAGTNTGGGTIFSGSGGPVISDDGTHVAFFSSATDLVASDTNGFTDLFVRDLGSGTTFLASVNAAGTASGNNQSGFGACGPEEVGFSLSADGKRVSFNSFATDLTSLSDTNGNFDVFVRDVGSGTTTLVSVNSAGTGAGNGGGCQSVISADGTKVVFSSGATDLVTSPAVSFNQIYQRDLTAGVTSLVSINSAGTASGDNLSGFVTISGDGTTVAFNSNADDLVGFGVDTNFVGDVFLRPVISIPDISINDVSVNEGNAGTTLATFTVTLSAPSVATVTVDFQTMDNTATLADSDYVMATGTVTFLPGQTSKPINVTINGDTSIEPTETFFVNLSNPTNATMLDGQGVGTITNDDGISINDVTLTEGNAGTVTANFTVTLSSASLSTVTVDFATAPNTATSGTDFVANSGTLTFLPGQLTKPVTVMVNGDTLDEINETFFVNLSNATNAPIVDSQGVGTILDDDATVPGSGLPTALVSINLAGTNSGNALSQSTIGCVQGRQCMSSNGRFVVFESLATDLTAIPDTNGTTDVFVRDTLLGTTTLVSVNSAGTAAGNSVSGNSVISPDGTKVFFQSDASDLVATDTNGAPDIFVRDLVGGTTTLVSVNVAGTDSGNAGSFLFPPFVVAFCWCAGPAVSADGNRVVFTSSASDLTAISDTNAGADVFVRDVAAATTSLISVDVTGTFANVGIVGAISGDGNKVAFITPSALTANDGNTFIDVFLRDLVLNTTTLVSINAAGTGSGNEHSQAVTISTDGTKVAFASRATNLVTGLTDTNAEWDVFVRDLGTSSTTLVSLNAAGTGAANSRSGYGNTSGFEVDLSSDGNIITFSSSATDLVATTDTNSAFDVFVRNVTAGTTTLVTINAGGTGAANFISGSPVISGDGSQVVFASGSTDLVPTPCGSCNGDIYLRNLGTATTRLISLNSAGTAGGNGGSINGGISADGSTVVFSSFASDLVPFGVDSNGTADVFQRPSVVTPSISINDVSVTEGDAGTVNLNFTVSLSAASVATITVDFVTNGVTATSGTDFVANSGTLTFVPTDVSEPVTITINGDTKDEFDETFTVDLSNATNATIADAQGVATILDNDPVPTLSINDVAMAEGDAGTTNMVFTVSLSAVSGKNVSVTYLTADNTATQPSDYTLTSGTLNILAGNPSGPISVPIVGDTAPESNETFFVNLSVPVNADLGEDDQGQGTITDDDSGPPFTMSASESSITCTAGATAHFNVTVTPSAPPLNTPVSFSCSGNPPQSTCTITPSSVAPGSSPASVEVQIQTTASSALLPPPWEREHSPIYAAVLLPGLVGLVLVTPSAGKRRLRRLLELVLLLLVSLALLTSGCGGGGGNDPRTPAGTYTVTITGTSGAASNSTSITLTIRP